MILLKYNIYIYLHYIKNNHGEISCYIEAKNG